jgi:hypothetical protein
MNEFDRHLETDIAEGERWLASFATPEPSPAVIEQTKERVRAALAGASAHPTAGRWSVWHGILAAAASIALAVTVGWMSARQQTTDSMGTRADADELNWIAEAGQDALARTTLDSDLSSLEKWSAGEPWNVDGAALYDTLDGVLNDVPASGAGEKGSSQRPQVGPSETEEA